MEHWFEFRLLKLFGSHCGTTENQYIVFGYKFFREIFGKKNIGINAASDFSCHGLGISGAAPINDCDIIHGLILQHILSGRYL